MELLFLLTQILAVLTGLMYFRFLFDDTVRKVTQASYFLVILVVMSLFTATFQPYTITIIIAFILYTLIIAKANRFFEAVLCFSFIAYILSTNYNMYMNDQIDIFLKLF